MELKDILRFVSVFCIFFLQVGINFLLGYLIAYVIFAAVIPRPCRRWTSVLSILREAYSMRALKDFFSQVRKLRSWKKEVGTWTFFTIGARHLFSFSERESGLFYSSLGLTVFGSLFLVLQWKRDMEEKIAFDLTDNVEKNAEDTPSSDG
jgi:hypothetical protein